ncbi:MAG: sugar ABC transporter permease [Clostridiales bacterium]|nr:sugar ABC transporter permease [Clostridiales bacterium]
MAKTTTKNQWKAWLYLLPALVILAVFTIWPIINTVRMSMLKNYNGLAVVGGGSFEFGFYNFKHVIEYDGFTNALGNTLLLCVITVPISTMLALLIAVALNSIKFIRRAMQTIFFLPYVTNSIAIGMVFMAMFYQIGGSATNAPDSVGIINNIIEAFGGTAINWVNMGSSKFANMTVLVIYIVWNALPFKILVLLGGLQGVNKQYYDAAKIDGTSRFRTFWRITVPLLSPMIAYVVITGFIGGFKEYSSIVGIFGATMGPTGTDATNNMNTMVGYIYDSLKENNQGGASAAALILFAIIFVVTMINMYVSKKKVHY